MNIEYTKISLATIIEDWGKKYTSKRGEVFDFSYFVDPVKGQVLYELYVRSPEALPSDQGSKSAEDTDAKSNSGREQ